VLIKYFIKRIIYLYLFFEIICDVKPNELCIFFHEDLNFRKSHSNVRARYLIEKIHFHFMNFLDKKFISLYNFDYNKKNKVSKEHF